MFSAELPSMAAQTVADAHETPLNDPDPYSSAGYSTAWGVPCMDHAVPLKRSASVPGPGHPLPTATHWPEDQHETPYSSLESPRLGGVWADHDVPPLQLSARAESLEGIVGVLYE
jgi:hypothetical protein